LPKIDKSKKKYNKEWLTQDEIKTIFESPDLKTRDLLLIKTIYGGALRISEAINALYEDFKYEDDYSFMVLRSQKTDKRNWEKQPIPLGVFSEIKRYCEDKKIKFQDSVFQSRQSEKLSYNRTYQIVKECVKKVGIKKEITTHTFRRSRLTHLLDDGNDIFFVKEFARHKSIDTTRKYLKISKKKLFNQMSQIDKQELSKAIL